MNEFVYFMFRSHFHSTKNTHASHLFTLLQIIFSPFIIHSKKYHTFHSPLLIHPFIHKIFRSKFQSNSSPIPIQNRQPKKARCLQCQMTPESGTMPLPGHSSKPAICCLHWRRRPYYELGISISVKLGTDHKKYIEKLYTLLLSNFNTKFKYTKK